MKTINQEAAAQRMAQWLATGGALDAAAHEESGRDDGLQAAAPTPQFTCHVDDGLMAQGPTGRGNCYADDGLAACTPTIGCPGFYGDDGLQAALPSMRGLCHADDGLTAGGYTTSFCPVMAPVQAPAR
jgi:hypothetical protein